MDQLEKAHRCYLENGLGARDDAARHAVPDPGLDLRQQAPLHGALRHNRRSVTCIAVHACRARHRAASGRISTIDSVCCNAIGFTFDLI
jgi:hypothetical protein